MKKNELKRNLKLTLNRETLRALEAPALAEVAGGLTDTDCPAGSCLTCKTRCC
jgi:hypothetical protein